MSTPISFRLQPSLEEAYRKYRAAHPDAEKAEIMNMALRGLFERNFNSDTVILNSLSNLHSKIDNLQNSIESNTELMGYFIKAFLASIPDPSLLSDEEQENLKIKTEGRYKKFVDNFIAFLLRGNERLCSQIVEGVLRGQRDFVAEENNDSIE